MAHSIFYDLGIDPKAALSEPDQFAAQVKVVADKLRENLSRNTSTRVSERTERFRNEVADDKEAILEADYALQQIIDIVGGLSEAGKVHLTVLMPRISRIINGDIENAAFVHYQTEADDEPMDKKTTHMMYIELRTVYNNWVKFQNTVFDGDSPLFAELPAIPGNFSSNSIGARKTQIVYTFDVPTEKNKTMNFIAHTGLQRYLNEKYPSLGLVLVDKVAAIEWVQEHPEYKVTIKEIRA